MSCLVVVVGGEVEFSLSIGFSLMSITRRIKLWRFSVSRMQDFFLLQIIIRRTMLCLLWFSCILSECGRLQCWWQNWFFSIRAHSGSVFKCDAQEGEIFSQQTITFKYTKKIMNIPLSYQKILQLDLILHFLLGVSEYI